VTSPSDLKSIGKKLGGFFKRSMPSRLNASEDDDAAYNARRAKALSNTDVAFSLDTNILIHFHKLELAPWREIAPNANRVRIIVPSKTGEEMDRHKDEGSGRAKRRAIEFQKTIRLMENSSDRVAVLRESDPTVTVEFTQVFHRSDLDGNRYELDDSDGRIVAETAAHAADHPNLILFSDDAKPLNLAWQTGLLSLRPPAEWRTEEGPDDRDNTIADLHRQLGAQPELSVSFPYGDESLLHRFEVAPKAAIPTQLRDALEKEILAENSIVPRDVILEHYELISESPFNLSIGGSMTGVTAGQLKTYEEDYAEFESSVVAWANGLFENLQKIETFLPIHLSVVNQGTAIAEKVIVEVSLSGDFSFVPMSIPRRYLELGHRVPETPVPRGRHGFLASMANISSPIKELQRSDRFYRLSVPEEDGSTDILEFGCDEFHHDHEEALKVLVWPSSSNGKGALYVKVRSAQLADPIKYTVPLRVTDLTVDDHAEYIRQRLDYFPSELRDLVEAAIDQLT